MEADAQNPHMPYIHGGRGPYVRGFITIFMASDMALLFFFFEILKKKKKLSPGEKYKCM